MKRIISLLVSAIMVFSMAIAASASPITLINKEIVIDATQAGALTDTADKGEAWVTTLVNGETNKAVKFRNGGSIAVEKKTDSLGNEITAVKHPTYSNETTYGITSFWANAGGTVGAGLSDGLIKITGKFFTDAEFTKPYIRANGTNSYNINSYLTDDKTSKGASLIKPDTWYDFTIEVEHKADISDSFRYSFVPQDGSETITDSKKFSTGYAFASIWVYFAATEKGKSRYWGDLKIEVLRDETQKAEILCVGDNNIVEKEDCAVTFELSQPIVSLEAEHVSITDSRGNEYPIASIETDSTGMLVTANLESELMGGSNYTLTISTDCYKDYVAYDENGEEVSVGDDITMGFSTAVGDFGIVEPDIEMSGDGKKVEFSTEIVNKTNENFPVTVMLAVYDAEGQMVAFEAVDIADTYNADGTATPVTIKADFDEGHTAQLFMIKGWAGLRPLFGGTWGTSYSSLNP